MTRLHRQPMQQILRQILADTYRVGERLPPETELVQTLDVSRGVVRECLRGLEERGVVNVRHGVGAVVNDDSKWNILDAEVLSALVASSQGPRLLAEYIEARVIVETEAAALAAERATKNDVAKLQQILDRMTVHAKEAATNPLAEDEYHESDIEFHQAVIAAMSNRALGRIVGPIQRQMLVRLPLARPAKRIERSLPEHRLILEAISDGDPDRARAAMYSHLSTVRSYLAEYSRDHDVTQDDKSGSMMAGLITRTDQLYDA